MERLTVEGGVLKSGGRGRGKGNGEGTTQENDPKP